MKRFLLALTAVVLVVVGLSEWNSRRSSVYDGKMKDLRTQVRVGDDIHTAVQRIEGRYPGTIGPLDPTRRGKELWLHVDFGIRPSALESLCHAVGVELPPKANRRRSGIIKATPDGTITQIE